MVDRLKGVRRRGEAGRAFFSLKERDAGADALAFLYVELPLHTTIPELEDARIRMRQAKGARTWHGST